MCERIVATESFFCPIPLQALEQNRFARAGSCLTNSVPQISQTLTFMAQAINRQDTEQNRGDF
jgi:hypothetical protein